MMTYQLPMKLSFHNPITQVTNLVSLIANKIAKIYSKHL